MRDAVQTPAMQDADVEVRIRGLMMDPVTNMPMIVLKDVNGDGALPIWVGIFEAKGDPIKFKQLKLKLTELGEVGPIPICDRRQTESTRIGLGQGSCLWSMPFGSCCPPRRLWQQLSHHSGP